MSVHESAGKSKAKFGIIDGISGIKLIGNDNSKEKFLGQAGTGIHRNDIRSSSVDKTRPAAGGYYGDVRILSESSTISIPAINISSSSSSQMMKPYKTMPSPVRPNAVQAAPGGSNSNCLKEIFEECDAGSSDNNSNTNTPRAILRSQANATHHRRTKFHKSRTTSGSSTDGSDDDNAEKKRASKIIDNPLSKQFTQRRDSHDDSSDSQEPGAACSGNSSTASSTLILRNGSSSNNNKTTSQTRTGGQDGKTTTNSSDVGYRKHRTGRRRQTETRLRESQSLNRITEVQEQSEQANCEHNINKAPSGKDEKSKPSDAVDDGIKSKIDTLNQINSKNSDINNATNELKASKNQNNSKAKGLQNFKRNFLQNFKRNHEAPQPVSVQSVGQKSNRNPLQDAQMRKMNNGKLAQMPNDGSDRSKKIKILGRYFQVSLQNYSDQLIIKFYFPPLKVHRKICQPLTGLFRSSGSARLTSNLYKAQSCSSIIRDGVHHPNGINSSTLSTSSSSMTKNSTKFDEKLICEQKFLIKNCLDSRFIGSVGDINDSAQDNAFDKKQQLLDYIDDDILQGSKC